MLKTRGVVGQWQWLIEMVEKYFWPKKMVQGTLISFVVPLERTRRVGLYLVHVRTYLGFVFDECTSTFIRRPREERQRQKVDSSTGRRCCDGGAARSGNTKKWTTAQDGGAGTAVLAYSICRIRDQRSFCCCYVVLWLALLLPGDKTFLFIPCRGQKTSGVNPINVLMA